MPLTADADTPRRIAFVDAPQSAQGVELDTVSSTPDRPHALPSGLSWAQRVVSCLGGSRNGHCASGGRLHWLRRRLGCSGRSAIAIIGFQAEGTLERRLVDVDKRVRLFGEEVSVRAGIHTIVGLSAQADRAALLNWLKRFETAPQRSFVVHDGAQTACGFADRTADELGWSVEAPAPGTRIDP